MNVRPFVNTAVMPQAIVKGRDQAKSPNKQVSRILLCPRAELWVVARIHYWLKISPLIVCHACCEPCWQQLYY